MSQMSTLHEICVARAKKQPGIADSLTEEAPILEKMRWKPASHGMWNVAEKVTDIIGPGFVEADAPLPFMSASTDLVHTDLHMLGGRIEVPTLKAKKFGGPAKYFAERQNLILRKAGMDTEVTLVMKNWFAAAKAMKNLKDGGGTGKGWFLLAIRLDEINNCGLYDPDQFDQGRLLKIDLPYNGAEHYLHGPGLEGVLGYTVVYRGNFGWQIIDAKRTCAGIVNIDELSKITPAMIDDMLADVRATPANTYLICSPKAKIYAINPHKVQNVWLNNGDTDAKTRIETWNGIPIIVSHNLSEKINNVTV